MRALRERLALRLAPWLHVPYREGREEAFKDLALVAYLSRDAVWTSPRVLVRTALAQIELDALLALRMAFADCDPEGTDWTARAYRLWKEVRP